MQPIVSRATRLYGQVREVVTSAGVVLAVPVIDDCTLANAFDKPFRLVYNSVVNFANLAKWPLIAVGLVLLFLSMVKVDKSNAAMRFIVAGVGLVIILATFLPDIGAGTAGICVPEVSFT